jgi:hypothetical protein
VLRTPTLEECQGYGAAAGCETSATSTSTCSGTSNGQPLSVNYVCCAFKNCDSKPVCGGH